jgi:hypothetical protein
MILRNKWKTPQVANAQIALAASGRAQCTQPAGFERIER